MQFKRTFLTRKENTVSVEIQEINGEIKVNIWRQHKLVGSCVFQDTEDDPIMQSEDSGKVVSREAEDLFNKFRKLVNL